MSIAFKCLYIYAFRSVAGQTARVREKACSRRVCSPQRQTELIRLVHTRAHSRRRVSMGIYTTSV